MAVVPGEKEAGRVRRNAEGHWGSSWCCADIGFPVPNRLQCHRRRCYSRALWAFKATPILNRLGFAFAPFELDLTLKFSLLIQVFGQRGVNLLTEGYCTSNCLLARSSLAATFTTSPIALY